jgi:transposase
MRMVAVLGIDLGKNSCSLAGLDASGAVVLRRRTGRQGILALAERLPPCVVAMEACCGAHHLGRLLRARGHQVRLMSPEYVRPYVKAQKNDDRDAEAIAEAATRPTMRFVELKSEERLDLQTLHRVRDRLVGQRTALINQLRAVLLERGVVAPQGRRKLEQALAAMMQEEGGLPLGARMRALVEDMRAEWRELDRRIGVLDDEFAALAKADEAARRLATIPGIGVLSATALVAAIGDGRTFARGRDLAAWLGLVPRQATTGGKPRLLGISKRGNGYLRRLLIHGARAAMPSLSGSATPLGAWLSGLLARAHRNVAVVALAARLARIVIAVLRGGGTFEARAAAAQPTGSPGRADPARAGGDVRGWWERDGLTVDRRPGTLGRKMARRRRRRFYEDPGARTSISAGARPRDRIG